METKTIKNRNDDTDVVAQGDDTDVFIDSCKRPNIADAVGHGQDGAGHVAGGGGSGHGVRQLVVRGIGSNASNKIGHKNENVHTVVGTN